jgi:hypothetical protein
MNERITYISVIAALTLTLLFMMKGCSSKDAELQISKQNVQALTDKTRETRNLLDQLQFEKKAFMGDIETLKDLNQELTNELEKQRGEVKTVTKVVTKFVFDTILIDNRVDRINDSMFVINFDHVRDFDSCNSVAFSGKVPTMLSSKEGKTIVTSQKTTIYDMNIDMKLYTGIKEEKGIYSIFARTDFPGVKFDLDGAIVDPEKSFINKKTSPFSLMLGGGLGYGVTPSGNGVFPSVGIFVGINLLNF